MIDILNTIYKDMQNLEIQPTDHNVSLLSEAYGKIRELAEKIVQAEARIRDAEKELESCKAPEEAPEKAPEDEEANG